MKRQRVDPSVLKSLSSVIQQATAAERYSIWFTGHAEKEMGDDGLSRIDVIEALAGCRITSCRRRKKGGWRYVVEGETLDAVRLAIVVEIIDEEVLDLTVVTVWIKERAES